MLRRLTLITFWLTASTLARAQNYNSSMNSLERARESRRYEDALRDGTYNNPMLKSSGPAVRAGDLYLRQRQAEQESIATERRNEFEARQREEQRQAYLQRQAEIAASNQELDYAERGMRFWGPRNLRSDPSLARALTAYRAGDIGSIPVYDLYGSALALLVEKTDGSNRLTEREAAKGAAQLAVEACRRGQFLPAFLLADPDLASDDLKRALADHGNLDRTRTPYYYVGWAWPYPDEYDAARQRGLATPEHMAERARARQLAKQYGEEPYDDSDHGRLFRILVSSRLTPWVHGDLLVRKDAQQALVELRRNRPATGVFLSALYEDILRYERDRPSPWADLLYAHAAKLSGEGFISAFVQGRSLENRIRDREQFELWQAWRAQGMNPAGLSAIEPNILVRVAGRLLLNHDVAQLDPGTVGLEPQDADRRRHRLAHSMLFDLTLHGDRNALTLQYLAIRHETAQYLDRGKTPPFFDEPSLNAYGRALLSHLGLEDFSEFSDAFEAAAWMESAPVSSPTAYYSDRPRWKTLGISGGGVDEDPLAQRKFSNSTTYHLNSSEWSRLIGVRLPGIISAATLLDRYKAPDLAERCDAYFKHDDSPSRGFAAVLIEVQRARLARITGDTAEHKRIMRRMGDLTIAQSPLRWNAALWEALRASDHGRIQELLNLPEPTERLQLAWLQQLPDRTQDEQGLAAPLAAHLLMKPLEEQAANSFVSGAEWAEAARAVAQYWKVLPATEQIDFQGEAFSLALIAEAIAPDRAKTEALIARYPKRFYLVKNNRAFNAAAEALLSRATQDRDAALVNLLAPFYPANPIMPVSLYLGRIERVRDEVEGFPRRKAHERAHEAEVARGEALLARAGDLLKDPRHAQLAARVFYRAWMIDIYLQAFLPQLIQAANRLSPQGPGEKIRASSEPKHLAIQAHLLTAAIDTGMDDEDYRQALLAESDFARELWEQRADWSRGREDDLLAVLQAYSKLEQSWAQKAWSQLWSKPTAAIRLAALRTDLTELPVPAPTPLELASPEFVEATRQIHRGSVPDDPWTELEQVLSTSSPTRR